MARKEFPGDPRRSANVVPYTPATNAEEGSLYYLISFISSLAAMFLKSRIVGWAAVFFALLSVFTDRTSAAGQNSSRTSTIHPGQLVALYKLYRGEQPAASSS
ncbi:hypothetical protein DL89DRAFT_319739 [Linderina pennispora]|uniref:Uncharacterized protein n=1 Tax=Linderina pennispora TaxID=61395 RepID=A0A1Y1WKV5_9FUNG|nr:uncharacterized protein DL89DRAFT_319739 [Linderina pennispora]ORX74122.1 hypothetical protein DL89DRAFT_319739 [Linderina pennispora]